MTRISANRDSRLRLEINDLIELWVATGQREYEQASTYAQRAKGETLVECAETLFQLLKDDKGQL